MLKFTKFTLLVCLSLLLYACNQPQNSDYVITGILETVVVPASEGSGETSELAEKVSEWETAKFVVAQEITNVDGETETVELATGTFKDGEVTLTGNVDQPTKVKISAAIVGAEPLTLDAVIAPKAQISFKLIEYPRLGAGLDFYGTSRRVLDPSNRFSVSGNLNSIDADLERATVEVSSWEHDEVGEDVDFDFGKVLLEDGKFFIEAEVNEPKFVNVLVVLPASREYTQFNAIIEPGAEIEIVAQSSWLYHLTPISGTGKNAQLVESWEQSDEYVSLQQEYRVAYQEYQDESQGGGNTTTTDETETPKYREIRGKLLSIQNDFLEDVASNADDPMDALLALELGAYWGKEEALPIYDRLARSLDKDLVIRRVTHARNSHASNLARRGIDRSLVVGKSAPDFTLPDLAGEQMALSELQKKNEFVLVEFWASWCGPCIGAIPALKDLYSSYHKHGFEIVSVSVDEDQESWIEASREHALPWINLGELEQWGGEVATSYGVTFLPKNYLLNSAGEIVQKDLTTENLDQWLANQYEVNAEEDKTN